MPDRRNKAVAWRARNGICVLGYGASGKLCGLRRFSADGLVVRDDGGRAADFFAASTPDTNFARPGHTRKFRYEKSAFRG